MDVKVVSETISSVNVRAVWSMLNFGIYEWLKDFS